MEKRKGCVVILTPPLERQEEPAEPRWHLPGRGGAGVGWGGGIPGKEQHSISLKETYSACL